MNKINLSPLKLFKIAVFSMLLPGLSHNVSAQCGGNCTGIGGYTTTTLTPKAPITFNVSDMVDEQGNGTPSFTYAKEGLILKSMLTNNATDFTPVANMQGVLGANWYLDINNVWWPKVNGQIDYRILSGGAIRIKPDNNGAIGSNAYLHVTAPDNEKQMMIGFEPGSQNFSTVAGVNDALFWTGGTGAVAHSVIANTRGGAIKFAVGTAGNDVQRMIIANNGQVGIDRLPHSTYKLSVAGDVATDNKYKLLSTAGRLEFYGGGEFIASDATWGVGIHTQNGLRRLYVHNDGRVVIGTKAPNQTYKLAVDGAIVGQKLVATAVSNWADFVLDENYALPRLEEVENYVQHHKHLPGIPAESEVMEKGIDTADMMAKLLQKVEELTLYTIRQQKEIDALKHAQK